VSTPTETVRYAIEEVCSGRRIDELAACYSPSFVDHVNGMEYRGHEGIHKSVGLYQRIFKDLSFKTEQQISEGDRVATHWTLTGTYRGRSVKLSGAVISRLKDGKIEEDWAFTDSIEIARQLGVWRSLLLAITEHRSLFGRS
jgi:ketosteroid isomerase-like protein